MRQLLDTMGIALLAVLLLVVWLLRPRLWAEIWEALNG